MLTVKEAIQRRRSIRRFRPDPVSDEMIHELLEAARLAPSGSNRQPWRFLVVKDLETRRMLREAALDQRFIEEAPVVIVCCADLSCYTRAARRTRRQELIEAGVTADISPLLRSAIESELNNPGSEPALESFVASATMNSFIAIEHIVLTATALGLGSCWVGATGGQRTKEILGLPENIIIVALLPIGYPAQSPPPRPRLSLEEVVLKPPPSASA